MKHGANVLMAAAVGSICLCCLSTALAQNPVIDENAKQGTQDWLLKKWSVDNLNRSREIEGYCSHPSLRAGDKLSIYVSMNPPGQFVLDIYRMGYYAGDGGRHMTSMGPLDAIAQPDPAAGQGNVRECDWKTSAELTIPSDWLSGVYLGKLTALPSQNQSYVVFIVRDDRRAEFIFQCSDITWQAYNRWPEWSSLYDFEGNRWETRRSNDISFDRPYSRYYNGLPANLERTTRYVGSGEFLLWEFPLAFWMEAQGYDLTYISNIDTHADEDGLLRAKGFLSVGHDEYWTETMRSNVERARDRGVHLAFLGGNSVSHAIEIDENSSGQSNRVFRRNHHFSDEYTLMGASSYGVGLADWSCLDPQHWILAGSGMERGDTIVDLVGWEYHGPPLRQDESLSVIARGHVKTESGELLENEYATTVYEAESGAIVFNAGTCWWNMPLSSPPGFFRPNHGDFREDDPRVQTMTKNLFDRMLRQDVE